MILKHSIWIFHLEDYTLPSCGTEEKSLETALYQLAALSQNPASEIGDIVILQMILAYSSY